MLTGKTETVTGSTRGIGRGIARGLSVEHIEELPGHISNTWYNDARQGPELPMSYTLVLRKPG